MSGSDGKGERLCVALMRGINVGRAKRIAMADLRNLVLDLGFTEVKTILNSGNVVFRSPDLDAPAAAQRLQAGVATELGVTCRVMGLSYADFQSILHDNTLEDVADNPSRLQVAVLPDPQQGEELKPLLARDWGSEALALGRRAAYLWCPDGVLASELADEVGRLLGDATTMRNWSTIGKVQAKLNELV